MIVSVYWTARRPYLSIHLLRNRRHSLHGADGITLAAVRRHTQSVAPFSCEISPSFFTTAFSAWIVKSEYPDPLLRVPTRFVADAITFPLFTITALWYDVPWDLWFLQIATDGECSWITRSRVVVLISLEFEVAILSRGVVYSVVHYEAACTPPIFFQCRIVAYIVCL